jgi:NTE family protein
VGGAYHAGTLAAIHEVTGWDPRDADVVVGTSAGSGAGATLRAGLSAADMFARATGGSMSAAGRKLVGAQAPVIDLPTRPPRTGSIPRPAAPHLLGSALFRPWRGPRPTAALAGLLPEGSIPTDAIGARVRGLYGATRWPERPLWICAVRLRDGQRVVFGRDPVDVPDIGVAVEASSAIPGFFRPVRIGEERYIDGGVHSPTNAELLAGLSLDGVVVVSPMSGESGEPGIGSVGRMASSWSLGREIRQLGASGTPVVTIQPTRDDIRVMGPNAMDPSRRAEVARQAHRSAIARLERADASRLFADFA